MWPSSDVEETLAYQYVNMVNWVSGSSAFPFFLPFGEIPKMAWQTNGYKANFDFLKMFVTTSLGYLSLNEIIKDKEDETVI